MNSTSNANRLKIDQISPLREGDIVPVQTKMMLELKEWVKLSHSTVLLDTEIRFCIFKFLI